MQHADRCLTMQVESAVLLLCIRIWVAGQHRSEPLEARIHRVLETLGAADAAPYLEGLMFAVAQGATRGVAVQCICQSVISVDEQALLDAMALAQENRPFEALLLLRGFLSPEGARAAIRSAEEIGKLLARRGRFLDAQSASLQHFGLSADPSPRPGA